MFICIFTYYMYIYNRLCMYEQTCICIYLETRPDPCGFSGIFIYIFHD